MKIVELLLNKFQKNIEQEGWILVENVCSMPIQPLQFQNQNNNNSLGSGGSGSVFKCVESKGKDVAVKKINIDQSNPLTEVKRIQREIILTW